MTGAPFALPEKMKSQWRGAFNLPVFKKHRIDEHSLNSAVFKASSTALQKLTQALLREEIVNLDSLRSLPNGRHSLALSPATHLIFEHLVAHRMGAWSLHGRILIQREGQGQIPILLPSHLLTLLLPVLADTVTEETLTRLTDELDNSFVNDTLCTAFHENWNRRLMQDGDSFLASLRNERTLNVSLLLEQWGTTGHPWHPNYKTKLGLSIPEVVDYSPEFEACFDVVLCAVHKEFVHIESLPGSPDYQDWLTRWLPEAMHELDSLLCAEGLIARDYIALPVHPWQASETLVSLFASEIRDRLLVITRIKGFVAHPTMSFRTVVPNASLTAPMVKLPVGLRLTSVQRTVSPRSACMGPRVSALLMEILAKEPTLQKKLAVIPERVGLYFKSPHPSDDRARHLSVLYRANPNEGLLPGEIAIPVGSLFAMDHNNQPLLRQWVSLSEGSDTATDAIRFLDRYLYATLPGLLTMYVIYGIAFEAHQQNSFMVMGSNGQPSHLLLRDFGDIRIDREALHLRGLDLQLKDPSMTLYNDSSFVRDKLLHTAFMCHLGELILLVSRYWEIPESDLWQTLSGHVNCCFDDLRERAEPRRWHREREAILKCDWPAKSFLRMRLLDSPTDIVRRLKNPINLDLYAR